MKFEVKIGYIEDYLPTPRCRTFRQREAEGQWLVTVKEVTPAQFPIACIVHDGWDFHIAPYEDGTYPEKVYDVRILGDQMYKRPSYRQFVAHGEGNVTCEQLKTHINHCMSRIYSCYNGKTDFESRCQEAQAMADEYLIMNGEVWEKCGEPRYVIQTFGLGHNHGGTAGFIEHFYNGNIGKDNYFNAKCRESAVAYGQKVARRRGDTESVNRILTGHMIDVLMPEKFTVDPQCEHGDGDPFLRQLESVVVDSDSQASAALGVIGITLLSQV